MTRSNRWSMQPVDVVHRVGALILGLGLLIFAGLGFADGLPFFSTQGASVLGLSSNGALSTVSLVAGAVLIGAALWRGRAASTATAIMGGLFLLSGLLHLAILHTELNLLAFRLSNVFFSLIAGMILLFTGVYGRLSGGLPPENPYRRAHPVRHDRPPPHEQPTMDETSEDEQAFLDAEMKMGEGRATPAQEMLVRRELARRQADDRRRAWRHARDNGNER